MTEIYTDSGKKSHLPIYTPFISVFPPMSHKNLPGFHSAGRNQAEAISSPVKGVF